MGFYSRLPNTVQLRLYDREGQKFFVLLDRDRLRHGIVCLLAGADDNAIINGSLVKAIESALVYSGDAYEENCVVSGGVGNTLEVFFWDQPDQRADVEHRQRKLNREDRVHTRLGRAIERVEIWCARWLERPLVRKLG